MFGLFGGREKARKNAIASVLDDLLVQVGGYIDFEPDRFVGVIKEDPYVGGYVFGKLTCDATIFLEHGGLHKDDYSEVTGAVLLGLFGSNHGQVVSSAIQQHARTNSVEFQDGKNKGGDVAAFLRGLRSRGQHMTEHQDYKHAVDALRKANFPEDLIKANPYMGFHLIWFTEYMIENHEYTMLTQLMSIHSKPRNN